ncbi:MAG: ATP-binding protein [Syntrophobacteraceae bacterium]
MKFLGPLDKISLKNKIFLSMVGGLLIISLAIATLTRWIIISSLISELELRGAAIARTIAERGSGYILDKNYPMLLSLIYDESQLTERKHLVSYIFVVDHEEAVISHTFTRPFPEDLRFVNPVPSEQSKSVQLLTVFGEAAYDIAIPVTEGIYRIGAVHVGLNKNHIDNLVSKLRTTFLGFLSLVIVIFFLMSHRLAKHITMPISTLTRISDELSRGNFDIKLDLGSVTAGWDPSTCPTYANSDLPCWHFDHLSSSASGRKDSRMNLPVCQNCGFYRKRSGDEVVQLADSFHNMVWSIKLYRQRLHESEEKYRSLFDSGPDPIFVVDSADLRIIDANPRVLELYGFDKEELIGKSFLELEPNGGGPIFLPAQSGTAQACISFEKVLHQKKGDKPFFVNLHACHISYGGKPAIIIAAADITEMMEKDAQLIQASKLKSLGEMSAGIAHELNQPLNAIKMASEYLDMMIENKSTIPQDQLQQVVSGISTQVDRAADIITTLRAFGKKADLSKERVDINKPVRGVLSIVGRQFELENINIRLDLTDELPRILAHDNRLQQVFFNLVTNARDAINEKNEALDLKMNGLILIRSYHDGSRVFVEVEDNGAGIPESVRNKIFEPFFSTKETSHDMGLGLAISYRIVKDYNGDIEVRSREGDGTVFCLSFPAVAAAERQWESAWTKSS